MKLFTFFYRIFSLLPFRSWTLIGELILPRWHPNIRAQLEILFWYWKGSCVQIFGKSNDVLTNLKFY